MDFDNEHDKRYTNKYPECSPWNLSSRTLPASDDIYQDIGIKYGGFITPFIERSDHISRYTIHN